MNTPERRPITRRQSLRSVNQVREAAKQLRQSDLKSEVFSDTLIFGDETETPIAKPIAPKLLPEKYEILDKFFNSLQFSIRLLQLKGSMLTFSNIRRQVEILADRRFCYSHLAQIKFILPEAIELKKMFFRDEHTCCIKSVLYVSLDFGIVKNNETLDLDIANIRLSKLFRKRLVKFCKSNPEEGDVPQDMLPEPFNRSAQSKSSFAIEKPNGSFAQQAAVASHLPHSFKRRFSKQSSNHDIETVDQKSKGLTKVDFEPNPKLVSTPVKWSGKLPETPIKLVSTPAQVAPPLVTWTPDDESMMSFSKPSPSKLTRRSSSRKSLTFDSPVKNKTPVTSVSEDDDDDYNNDDGDDDLRDILSEDLFASEVDVPQDMLPEPFNRSAQSKSSIAIEKPNLVSVQNSTHGSFAQQAAVASHLPHSFKRRFSKQSSNHDTETADQKSEGLTKVDFEPNPKLVSTPVKWSGKLPKTPIKLVSTPAQVAPPLVTWTPDDESMMSSSKPSPSKLTRRSSSRKSLTFDSPVKNKTHVTSVSEDDDDYYNDDGDDDDLCDILSEDLFASEVNVPQDMLPEPFNRLAQSKSSIAIEKPKLVSVQNSTHGNFAQQAAVASHLPHSFKRRFSKQSSNHDIETVDQKSKGLTKVDFEPNPKLVSTPVKCSGKLPETPIKLVSTPAQVAPPLVTWTPDDESMMSSSKPSPSKLTIRSSSRKSLTFDSPVKNITPVMRVSEDDDDYNDDDGDDDLCDILSEDLFASIKEKEQKAIDEKHSSISQAKWRKQMIAGLPKLFDSLLFFFQSIKRSVVTKQELVHTIISSQLDMIDRREVDEQLRLLKELAPEWIYEKLALSGDRLFCVNKISSPESIRKRLSEAN